MASLGQFAQCGDDKFDLAAQEQAAVVIEPTILPLGAPAQELDGFREMLGRMVEVDEHQDLVAIQAQLLHEP